MQTSNHGEKYLFLVINDAIECGECMHDMLPFGTRTHGNNCSQSEARIEDIITSSSNYIMSQHITNNFRRI